MSPVFGSFKLKTGAAADNFLAESDVMTESLFEVKHHRSVVHQRQHVDEETGLQIGVFVKVVQYLLRFAVTLEVKNDPHALAVRFITHLGDTGDLAFT